MPVLCQSGWDAENNDEAGGPDRGDPAFCVLGGLDLRAGLEIGLEVEIWLNKKGLGIASKSLISFW